jgi:hypothetical protein
MHAHTDLAIKKLQMGGLTQAIYYAQDKTTILTGVAIGILGVFVENSDVGQLDSLLGAIESTVRG